MSHAVLALGVTVLTIAGAVWYLPALADLRAGADRPDSRRIAAAACLTGWGTVASLAPLLVANVTGFSVEAAVHLSALNRKGREKLVRTCLRPAIAGDRLSLLRDGAIAYRVKVARGGKTHRVMRPMEFMARLASIVAPPRFPLWRYHGVLAPASPWRARIVPRSASLRDCMHVGETKPGLHPGA